MKNKKAKNQGISSTEKYLFISTIRDDTVVLKSGGLRAVLLTSSINFALKNEDEQNAIIYAYLGFLNSLDFPIQIVVRSRKLDIDKYLDNVREVAETHDNTLLRNQTMEYAEYIQKLIEYADIMEKTFYVVIPYDPMHATKVNMFSKFLQHVSSQDSIDAIKRRHREFDELNKHLTQRVNMARAGLESCNLKVEQLSTQHLIELFYKIYNPGTAHNEKIEDLSKIDVEDL